MIYKINKKQFEMIRQEISREETKHKTIYQAIIDYINNLYLVNGAVTQLVIYDVM